MIRIPTVFIVGAGGSKPYGFPIGRELRDSVIRSSESLSWHTWLAEVKTTTKRSATEFTEQLRTSGYSSVDQFLEARPEFTEIGTLAIAAELMPCELRRKLFPPNAPRHDHWYETLAGLLSIGTQQYLQNRVSIVTFNYDRSLEFYLSSVIRTRLHHSRQATIGRHLKHIPVIHVHGQLGNWGGQLDTVERAPSGSRPMAEAVRLAASGIRVIHRARTNTPEFLAARRALRGATRIYFLGFGYNPTNLTRLGLLKRPSSASKRSNCIVRGTSLGLSTREWQTICKASMCGNMSAKPRYPGNANTFLRNAVDLG